MSLGSVTAAKVKSFLNVTVATYDTPLIDWINNIAQEVADATGKASISSAACTQGEENAITFGVAATLLRALRTGDSGGMNVSIEGVSYGAADPTALQELNWRYNGAIRKLPKSVSNKFYVAGVS